MIPVREIAQKFLNCIVSSNCSEFYCTLKVRRVQKYVETLDMLKIKNSMPSSNGGHTHAHTPQKQRLAPIQEQEPQSSSNGHIRLGSILQEQKQQQQQPRNYSNGHSQVLQPQQEASSRHSNSGVVVTTKWETFDSTLPPLVPAASASTSTSAANNNNNNSVHPRFNWEFFE